MSKLAVVNALSLASGQRASMIFTRENYLLKAQELDNSRQKFFSMLREGLMLQNQRGISCQGVDFSIEIAPKVAYDSMVVNHDVEQCVQQIVEFIFQNVGEEIRLNEDNV